MDRSRVGKETNYLQTGIIRHWLFGIKIVITVLMMKKYLKLMVTVVLLVLIVLGTYRWQSSLLKSMRTYRSPLADVEDPGGALPPPGDRLPPQVPRVVLVVIGGLGFDAMETFDLPTLERLRESGAHALMQSQPPSYAHPSWLTLISGANPTLNDGLLFNATADDIRPTTINTIFHNAHQQGLRTALVGPAAWRAVIPADLLTESVFTPFEDAQGDQQIVDNLRPLIEDESLDFMLIYFSQVDYAGRNLGGTEGKAYEIAAQQVDTHLNTLLGMLDLDRTTLIIAADHGHIARGGYGGHDAVVLRQSYIMFGKGVTPGIYSPIEQVDVAPTIALLLGLSLPTANQGRPLTEMIQISEIDQATTMATLARQRFMLAGAIFKELDTPPPDLSSETDKVQSFLSNKNFAGAIQLNKLLIDQTDEAIKQIQAKRQAKEKRLRLLLVVTLVIGLIGFSLWERTELWTQAILAALVVLAVYHGLYRLEELPYSFSTVTSPEQVWAETMPRMALSLFIGSLFYLIVLTLQQFTKTEIVLFSSYELIFFAALGFIAPALYGLWQYGLIVTWFFPPPALLFVHFTSLIQSFYAIVLGAMVPFIIVPINFLLQKWIAAYQRRQIMKLKIKTRP